ncbi:hypothetical protein [Streptomyces sp. NPDC058411]|uniref:hypothetical protein n=1 Tax=Streptomyces sp. NPDC058411 TaxID=3346485 RepID=UPI00365D4D13
MASAGTTNTTPDPHEAHARLHELAASSARSRGPARPSPPLTDTCGTAAMLAALPHDRPKAEDLDSTLAALGDH